MYADVRKLKFWESSIFFPISETKSMALNAVYRLFRFQGSYLGVIIAFILKISLLLVLFRNTHLRFSATEIEPQGISDSTRS